jgi:lipoprotein NlpI
MVVVAHLALRQNYKSIAAESLLAEWIKRFDSSAWTTQVMRYLGQDIKEKQLLALATDNDKMTEARAYIGMKLLLSGKRSAAREHLIWVKQNGVKTFYEYALADYELRRLEVGTATKPD